MHRMAIPVTSCVLFAFFTVSASADIPSPQVIDLGGCEIKATYSKKNEVYFWWKVETDCGKYIPFKYNETLQIPPQRNVRDGQAKLGEPVTVSGPAPGEAFFVQVIGKPVQASTRDRATSDAATTRSAKIIRAKIRWDLIHKYAPGLGHVYGGEPLYYDCNFAIRADGYEVIDCLEVAAPPGFKLPLNGSVSPKWKLQPTWRGTITVRTEGSRFTFFIETDETFSSSDGSPARTTTKRKLDFTISGTVCNVQGTHESRTIENHPTDFKLTSETCTVGDG